MQLSIFERLVLLCLAIQLPQGTMILRKLQSKLYSFALHGKIEGEQMDIFSRIEEC
jgi:hypothetical protein